MDFHSGPAQILVVLAENVPKLVQYSGKLGSELFAQLCGAVRKQLREVVREADLRPSLWARLRAGA